MSFVHYKFRSQIHRSRINFDGTGISVFDLKREIINHSKLGTGTEFDLVVYDEASGEGKFHQKYFFKKKNVYIYIYININMFIKYVYKICL